MVERLSQPVGVILTAGHSAEGWVVLGVLASGKSKNRRREIE